MSTTVASANILYKLRPHDAYAALAQVLADGPDLVGLQEWYVTRLALLRQFGDVRVVPALGTQLLRTPRDPAYHWISAVAGGNVVGARAERFDPVSSRVAFVSGFGRSDRPDRALGIEPPRATLTVNGRTHELDGRRVVIGRSKECDIQVADPNASRRHAELRREGDVYWLVDLGSTNGLDVNGKRTQRAKLADGDRFTIGTTELVFKTSS